MLFQSRMLLFIYFIFEESADVFHSDYNCQSSES